MWDSVCSNKICFNFEKSREQMLHLNRILSVKPTISAKNRPIRPEFLKRGGPQIEKQKQTQTKIKKENNLVKKQIKEIFNKPGKYYQRKTEIYPAFRRQDSRKYDESFKFFEIKENNIKFRDRIKSCRPYLNHKEMRKEAHNQEKYLLNLLKRPKNIPIKPPLNFVSVEKIKNKLFLYEQKNENNFIKSKSQAGGISQRRATSARKSNKSDGRDKKSNISQSAKKRKNLRIDEKNKNQRNNSNKKRKKDSTTTKNSTGN